MENLPLNLAHREERKAQHYLLHNKFDEAVNCHNLAASYLSKCMKLTSIPKALESLQLQREYHLRQIRIVNLKKIQFDVLKKAFEAKKNIMAHMKDKPLDPDRIENESKSVQSNIYRVMNEEESLFSLVLLNKNDGESNISSPQSERNQSTATFSKKCSKEDAFKELQILNQQLRTHIDWLVNELDRCENENKVLRSRISDLEAEVSKTRELPSLAPLEMPLMLFR